MFFKLVSKFGPKTFSRHAVNLERLFYKYCILRSKKKKCFDLPKRFSQGKQMHFS